MAGELKNFDDICEFARLKKRLVWLMACRKADLKALREFVDLLANYPNTMSVEDVQDEFEKLHTRIDMNKEVCKDVRDKIKEIEQGQ